MNVSQVVIENNAQGRYRNASLDHVMLLPPILGPNSDVNWCRIADAVDRKSKSTKTYPGTKHKGEECRVSKSKKVSKRNIFTLDSPYVFWKRNTETKPTDGTRDRKPNAPTRPESPIPSFSVTTTTSTTTHTTRTTSTSTSACRRSLTSSVKSFASRKIQSTFRGFVQRVKYQIELLELKLEQIERQKLKQLKKIMERTEHKLELMEAEQSYKNPSRVADRKKKKAEQLVRYYHRETKRIKAQNKQYEEWNGSYRKINEDMSQLQQEVAVDIGRTQAEIQSVMVQNDMMYKQCRRYEAFMSMGRLAVTLSHPDLVGLDFSPKPCLGEACP